MPRIFVAQPRLDSWIRTGRVEVAGDLAKLTDEGASAPWASLYLNPAVYFVDVRGTDADAMDVVGCVKSTQDLARLGGHIEGDFVLLGGRAYTVTVGVLAIPLAGDGTPAELDERTWNRLVLALNA